ncbi:winged helix-turn-helix domain-containing protein [Hyphococcus sp.]|uniref:winged helix-turn-helix domain-containing protein n=1 Tax=Hyphococcus sp. TaxID=2038636 RepID=UPI0035C69A2A
MSVTEFPAAGRDVALDGRPLRIGAAIYHPDTRRLETEGEMSLLEPRLGDLLMRLAGAGGPVSREALLDDVWGDDGSDEALTQAISKLRRSLGDENRPYRFIQTIPKYGYQLQAEPVESSAPNAVRSSLAGSLMAHLRGRREFYKGLATGVGLMLALIQCVKAVSAPTTIEREMILCPPGAPEGECTAMLDRS